MPNCKRCNAEKTVKSGKVRQKQRYRCNECGYHFVEGDERTNDKIAAKKAMCVLIYSMGKGAFRMLAKIFDSHPSQVYRWVRQAGASLPDPKVADDIQEMEFDEMWHFLQKKRTNCGSSRPWTVACGEPWPGCWSVVMLQRFDGSTKK